MLENNTTTDVTLEPLDDWIVVEPLDDSETPSGLIVPINEGSQTRSGIVAAVGPDVESIEPGEKVLYPREAGYEVRLVRSAAPRPAAEARGSARPHPRLIPQTPGRVPPLFDAFLLQGSCFVVGKAWLCRAFPQKDSARPLLPQMTGAAVPGG